MGLTHEEKDILTRSSVGEGLLAVDGERFPMKIIASEQETDLITTNADELNRRKNERQN